MKTTTTFALIAALAGLGATAAHAENHFSVGIGFNTAPVYGAPVYAAPGGHWEDVTTRVWVPARYVESRDAWGRVVNVLEPAHYAYATNRVWVENRAPMIYGGEAYGYGYARRDHDGDRDDRRWDRDDHRSDRRDHDGDRHDGWRYGDRR